jgi:hypothetical protein
MKTKNIEATFRNAVTPAARLAAWQAPGYGGRSPLAGNLHTIRERMAAPYACNPSFAEARAALIAAQGPELSSPEAESPILWVSECSPEVMDAHAGRDFLDHRGWYMDEDLDGTLETYAVQLARFPGLMFYAVKDSYNGDFRVMLEDWEEIDYSDAGSEYCTPPEDCVAEAARAVVRSNDSSTEREAEEARVYYLKDQAERDIEENRETLAALRSEIRDLCRELKALCPSPLAGTYPAAAKAIRRALGDLLADRRRLMDENETLAASI